MKKCFFVLALVPLCFFACGSDDEESSKAPVPAVTSAKIGDIYYSDGTCSKLLALEKTPIGIVVYVGNDSVSENMHGLVMALHNSGKEKWSPKGSPKGMSLFPLLNSIEDAIVDYSGSAKTKWLAEHDSYAAKSALNYDVAVPAETSGWFLPSIGQWIAVVNNFGAGVSSTLTPKTYTGGAQVLSGINEALSKVGIEGSDYTAISTKYPKGVSKDGQSGYFWSSSITTSDMNSYYAEDIVFHEENGIYVGGGSEFSSLYVRPFLAY